MNSRYTIALYIRLSIEDADNHKKGKAESNSITHQRNMLYRYVKTRQEFRDCEITELCDDGFSGTNMNRPGVKKLLDMAKAKEIDCVIVKDFSRFSRDYLTSSDYVEQIFPFLGIRFISLGDGYDSAHMDGTARGIDISFRNVIYGYYSKDLSMKVKSAKLTKARNGDFISPFAPIGYSKDRNNKNRLIIEEQGAAIVRRIFYMAGMGLTVLRITKLLNAEKVPTARELQNSRGNYHRWWTGIGGVNLWDNGMVTRILRDERYLGKTVYGKRYRPQVGAYKTRKVPKSEWVVVKGCHEAIVTGEEFLAAQQMLREYREKEYSFEDGSVYAGKIRCGHCGYALARRKKPAPQFFCDTKRKAEGFSCMEGHMKEQDITAVILSVIQACSKVFLDEKRILERAEKGNRIATMQRMLAFHRSAGSKIEVQKAELYDERASGRLTREQFLEKRETLSGEQEGLEQEADRLEAEIAGLKDRIAAVSQGEQKLVGYIKTHELTRQLAEDFVDCIYVYGSNSIHIEWKFQRPF